MLQYLISCCLEKHPNPYISHFTCQLWHLLKAKNPHEQKQKQTGAGITSTLHDVQKTNSGNVASV